MVLGGWSSLRDGGDGGNSRDTGEGWSSLVAGHRQEALAEVGEPLRRSGVGQGVTRREDS
jgi:hypothetical protein